MSNGDHGSAGLEPADSSRPLDTRSSGRSDRIRLLKAAETTLEEIGDYKAAREVGDAIARLASQGETEEGKRCGEGVDGEDPRKAQMT